MNFSDYDYDRKKEIQSSNLNDNESTLDFTKSHILNDISKFGNIKRIGNTNFVINKSGIGLYCTITIILFLMSLDLYIM